MFKVNKYGSRTTHLKPYSSSSIVDFQYVNASEDYTDLFFFPKERVRPLISEEIKNITHSLMLKAHTH